MPASGFASLNRVLLSPAERPHRPPALPEPRQVSPLVVAAAAPVGALAIVLTNAIAIVLFVPWPDGGAWIRIQHHFFDLSQHLGLGVLAGALMFAFTRCLTSRLWRALLVYAVVTVVAMRFVLGRVLTRQADAAFDGFLAQPLWYAFVVLCGLAIPAAHFVGALLSPFKWLRWLPVLVALGGIVTNHLILRDDYPSVHGAIGWTAATMIGSALAPLVVARSARRFAWRGRPRGLRLALGAGVLVALVGLVVPPSNPVRLAQFREPGAHAAWALAMTVWTLPSMPEAKAPEGSTWFSDRSSLPDIPAGTKPKLGPVVVVITVDALRADVVLDPANDDRFPTLARLKRTGTTFTMARAPGSQTSVSLSAFFSGKYFSQLYWAKHGVGRTRFDYPADDPSVRFPALLSQAGVSTASYCSVNFLADEFGISQGFEEQEVVPKGRRHAHGQLMVDRVVQRLQKAGPEPLFIYTHLMEPHFPYNRGKLKKGPVFERYKSEIEVADLQLARVLRQLSKPNLRRRSYLFVASDHGEAFGEHGTTKHTKTLYEELVRIPLLVRGPGVAKREVSEPVSLIDLGPTVLDLFALPIPADYMGQSLVPLLEGKDVELDRPILAEGRLRRALFERNGLKVIVDERRKVVEAFDLNRDPDELVNLFEREPSRVASAVAALRAFFDVHTYRKNGYTPVYKP